MSVVPYKDTPVQPELDWEAYFQSFKGEHGVPVPYGLRWLFSDGWTYSLTRFEGPEYPPPEDANELRVLQKTWRDTRRRILRSQYMTIRRIIKDLEDLQSIRDAILQQRIWHLVTDTFGDEYEMDSGEVKPVNLEPLRAKMEEIQEEVNSLNTDTSNE